MRLALIGAGALGGRHLQSLIKLKTQEGMAIASITVVDPSQTSLDTARTRAGEVASPQECPDIDFSASSDVLGGDYDLAIIATGAEPRMAALKQLVGRAKVKALVLEKFLFQTEPEYGEAASLLRDYGIPTYVHMPRSSWPGYADLQEALATRAGPLILEISTSRLNLLSNGVHFIDLMRELTGLPAGCFIVRPLVLDSEAKPAKRPGTMEADGTMVISTARGDQMMLSSFAEGDLPLKIFTTTPRGRAEISEAARQVRFRIGPSGEAQERPLEMYMCSEMAPVWKELILTGRCGLSDYATATTLHLAWMGAIRHLFAADANGRLPIT